MNQEKVYEFALKWVQIFRDPNTEFLELVDHFFADDCEELGFIMDCGHSFQEQYDRAFNDYRALERVIDDISDIQLLGNAVYSQWRYFNHWASYAEDILRFENRSWFILILSRIMDLTGDNPFLFQGIPAKMKLISEDSGWGPCPNEGTEIEQRLTINLDGKAYFTPYLFQIGGKNKKGHSKRFDIGPIKAGWILTVMASHFAKDYLESMATDVGSWRLELTNTKGQTYIFRGCLLADLRDGFDLSKFLRTELDMRNLMAFDGCEEEDIVNKITLEYFRLSKLKSVKEDGERLIWDYKEKLIIDRKTDSIEHVQQVAEQCKITKKYEIAEGVSDFLDGLNADDFFKTVVGNDVECYRNPDEQKDYKITVEYEFDPPMTITGTFDRNGLPNDYPDFIDELLDFITIYGQGEIFAAGNYGRRLRKPGELIYLSVVFPSSSKTYYYRTDDNTIDVGEYVWVPVGYKNEPVKVEVVDIEYFTAENAPLPPEKTKMILKEEDIILPPQILMYDYDGEFDDKGELDVITLERVHGMMVRCTMKDGSERVGYADVYGCQNKEHYNGRVHDCIYLWTWTNLNERTHEFEGPAEHQHDQTFEAVEIHEICKLEAIKHSNPRWGGKLTNRFFVDTSKKQ